MLRAHEEQSASWFRAKGKISGGAVEGLSGGSRNKNKLIDSADEQA
jgi:hypothetical protein